MNNINLERPRYQTIRSITRYLSHVKIVQKNTIIKGLIFRYYPRGVIQNLQAIRFSI